jgi:hypothetical protein
VLSALGDVFEKFKIQNPGGGKTEEDPGMLLEPN